MPAELKPGCHAPTLGGVEESVKAPAQDQGLVRGAGQIETRLQRVVLETGRYRISGDLTLPSAGYRSRFSDLLNRDDLAFISLVNAEITPLDGGEVETRPFIAVGRDHVQIAYEK
jgi:hypothetical protein